MQRRASLWMVFLLSCGGVDGTSERRATPAPGAITQPDLGQPGDLNARSANLGPLFSTADGRCYVRVPPEDPLPPGARGETRTVPCPKQMTHPSFASCGFGIVSRTDGGDCVCRPWEGDPPPPSTAIECPRGL